MKCGDCPVDPARTCYGESVRKVCRRAAQGERHWINWLLDRAGQERPDAWPPRSGPVKACILSPVLYVGGAERWMASMLKFADPARVRWEGLGTVDSDVVVDVTREEIERYCPAVFGEPACRALASRCEVVIAWGLARPDHYTTDAVGRPKIITSSHFDINSEFTRSVMAASSAVSDALVAVSRVAVEPFPPDVRNRVIVIDNGVDRSRLVPAVPRGRMREAWGIPPGNRVLGFLGRVSAEKSPQSVAETLPYLPRNWSGAVVGRGLAERETIDHAAIRAPGRVAFPGSTTDVASAYRAFDWMLVPSAYEGFCYSMAEAMVLGIPVIATRVGLAAEHPELIREVRIGATGQEIRDALRADVDDMRGTAARCRKARKVMRSKYIAEKMGSEWSALIWRLTRGDTAGRR